MRSIPYGHQDINAEDIKKVIEVLTSDYLTQGPSVKLFEDTFAQYCGAKYAIAVANGTAALHLATLAAGFDSNDEVITSPITFVATANAIVYAGAKPVFADINQSTYCLDPKKFEQKITSATRGVIPVHFAGQPCEIDKIHEIAKKHHMVVIEDAAHALGARYESNGKINKIGSCTHSDMTIFSFHPVKHITTGEGGMITTNQQELYQKLCLLRSHGITRNPEELSKDEGPWYYEQQELGFNYRITDFQCALGVSQLKRIDSFIARRKEIVSIYNLAFSSCKDLVIPIQSEGNHSSWHLYVIGVPILARRKIFESLRDHGLGVNVHYIPVHLQPYYSENFSFREGDYPIAEKYYRGAITLPLYPGMTDVEVHYVVKKVLSAVEEMNQ
jgi:UDP-4-amino-4,6-dideoxy-N-acetyl-beta-L-altrosamine transaminase